MINRPSFVMLFQARILKETAGFPFVLVHTWQNERSRGGGDTWKWVGFTKGFIYCFTDSLRKEGVVVDGWGERRPQLSSRIWSPRELYRIIHVFVAFSCELSGDAMLWPRKLIYYSFLLSEGKIICYLYFCLLYTFINVI